MLLSRPTQLEKGGYRVEFMDYDWSLNDAS